MMGGRNEGGRSGTAVTARFKARLLTEGSASDMAEGESHYDVLGITPDANQDKVHRAYTTLLKAFQSEPDSPELRAFLARAKVAYQVLSHPESRAAYHAQQEMSGPPKRTWAVPAEDTMHPAFWIGIATFFFGLPGLLIAALWAMFTRRKDTPARD